MWSWVEKAKPKLIVGVGRSRKADFKAAFGFTDARETDETIVGRKLVLMRKS